MCPGAQKPELCKTAGLTEWVEGIFSLECPVRGVGQYLPLLQVWHLYQKGMLPQAGGVLDQPALLIDALEVIDRCVGEIRKKQEDEG